MSFVDRKMHSSPWDCSDFVERRQIFLTIVNTHPRPHRREKYKGIWKHNGESEIREDFLRRRHLTWGLED